MLYQKQDQTPDVPAFMSELMEHVIEEQQGTFFACNSKTEVIKTASLLIEKLGGDGVLEEEHFITEIKGRTIITITSKNSQSPEVQEFRRDINVSLSSPSMGTGHSIDLVEGQPLFERCFASFTGGAGNLLSDCLQHMSRVRGCAGIHLIIKPITKTHIEDKALIATLYLTGVKPLGDPHLGRKFENGVPIYRLGEREELVWKTFEQELVVNKDTEIHVCMGDLFDKFRVPEEVILRAFSLYFSASKAAPETNFIVIRGNHDAGRDMSVKSSFDVFEALCEGLRNVIIVSDEAYQTLDSGGRLHIFYPWHPFKTAKQIVAECPPAQPSACVYGHWGC